MKRELSGLIQSFSPPLAVPLMCGFERCQGGKLYSARLYKGGAEYRNRAVFCMCYCLPQYIKYCDKVMVEKYVKYEISSEGDGKIEQSALVIASEDVFLKGEVSLGAIDVTKKSISKMDIDLPLLMNVEDISDFPDYPPNIVVNLTDPNPAWTLSLYGLTKEVVFKVSAHQTVQELEEELSKTANEQDPSLKSLLQLKWEDEEGHQQIFRLVDHVSARWTDFGIQLGITQNILDAWESEYSNKARKCWQKVMRHWLKGKCGALYPSTWEGLYSLLKDLEYGEVARKLEDAVKAAKQNSHGL